jgi:hypothetical protein
MDYRKVMQLGLMPLSRTKPLARESVEESEDELDAPASSKTSLRGDADPVDDDGDPTAHRLLG